MTSGPTPPSPVPAPTPREPITPPPTPQTFTAPHNLYTLSEVITALRRLADGGLGPHQQPRVRIDWLNGADSSVLLGDLDQLTALEDVQELWLYWTYTDGSSVTGNLLNRPQAGKLKVEKGGRALAAATDCMEVLRGLRQQRARVRTFLAGQAPRWLIVTAFLSQSVASFLVGGASIPGSIPAAVWAIVIAGSALVAILVNVLLAWVRRRMGGTRLAQPSEAHRQLLTTELGVLAAALGPPIAIIALFVAL